MNKFSFLAETPTVALRLAQAEYGEDVIVISTRKIDNAHNSNGQEMYEVVVTSQELKKDIEKSSSKTLEFKVYDFKDEIFKMQETLEQVKQSIWKPKSQLYDLTIPIEFINIYTLFEKNEFDKEMIYHIMKKTIKQLPMSLKSNPEKINDFFKLILRKMIPIKFELPLRKHQRKIIMMLGPTGVGKTTTISKLAARYAYKSEKNYKVGIITLDLFRLGAVEQLKAYTNIMRLDLEIVKKTEDLPKALLKLKDCDYIFIDTAGCSQYDIEKIELINTYQKRVEGLAIEKILVLPANVKYSDLLDIYTNYSRLKIDYLTFTKLDETKSFGNLISFAYKTKKTIKYFSIGQNIPNDLLIADSSFLIDCFMNNKCIKK